MLPHTLLAEGPLAQGLVTPVLELEQVACGWKGVVARIMVSESLASVNMLNYMVKETLQRKLRL